ncbi:flagellin FliC [Citrobacter braakii]|uniref:flagellin N-terminal helical domain-containing protein n=1 Tax=Citrobacter TaxID=544 RepID=UPI0015EA1573|nr:MULTISPECIES: flagellin [Citrobacter]MBM3059866.1 flagellin FliC [Citrobacter braakii]MBM3064676.1 flagellin FliC [Citrobacter braakii]QLS53189.1 flagellin FliC [Citrobacter sp. RHBSTW-00887]WBU74706.1 flagellin [Citrobacter braakii]
MAQVINTNSLSLLTQNNLNKSQSSLSSAIERLSSGLRINSAKDDAAGQAIANRFTSNIKGLTQASRNANDGISVAQTTEGALSEINNNLQRVRELAVQATNGTNSQSDLDSIQNEITQRLGEIDRVSGQTQFNGVKVLASDSSMKIQVGANDGETITIDLKEITSKTLGLTGFNVNGKGEVANKAATADSLTLAGFDKGVPDKDGTITFKKDVDNAKATASDVMTSVKDKSTLHFDGTGNGLGVAATDNKYTYDAASKSYSFSATGVSSTNALNKFAPNAGDSFTANVKIGATTQDVKVSKDGTITSTDGKALFLDAKGNLTQTSNGQTKAATWDNLIANTDTTGLDAYGNPTASAVNTTIKVGDTTITSVGGSAEMHKANAYSAAYKTAYDNAYATKYNADYKTTYDAQINGGADTADAEAAATAFATGTAKTAGDTAGVAAGTLAKTAMTTPSNATVDVSGAKISATEMAKDISTGDFTVTDGQGAGVYSVTAGAVKYDSDGAGTAATAKDAFTDIEGKLTNVAKETVNYYAHSNGAVTNNAGSKIYLNESGKLTTESTTKSTSTSDPLKALDDALAKVDALRSDLGAVQNRFDSAITNLGNTVNNLSSARSRIEDSDYATEVSNMSRAQILQQAGTSVLAQANQTTQNVLSLLR